MDLCHSLHSSCNNQESAHLVRVGWSVTNAPATNLAARARKLHWSLPCLPNLSLTRSVLPMQRASDSGPAVASLEMGAPAYRALRLPQHPTREVYGSDLGKSITAIYCNHECHVQGRSWLDGLYLGFHTSTAASPWSRSGLKTPVAVSGSNV